MEMIKCVQCKNPMPKLRLQKYNYKFCVNCSEITSYNAVTTLNGTNDDTWNDIQIIKDDQLDHYNNNNTDLDSLDLEE
mgnify:FL=1|tara:strand:+ start:1691 stop:1924 length:234 start_codon:yes stop_codon:yes gene_type:complete